MVDKQSVQDNDLLDLQVKYGPVLQWLIPLLEEIQYLRNNRGNTEYTIYLEDILTSLNATFDKEPS